MKAGDYSASVQENLTDIDVRLIIEKLRAGPDSASVDLDMGQETDKETDKESDCIVMVELATEGWRPPDTWVRLELDDYETHSAYPALVQEIREGWVTFYGKLPGDEGQGNPSHTFNQLIHAGNNGEEVVVMG